MTTLDILDVRPFVPALDFALSKDSDVAPGRTLERPDTDPALLPRPAGRPVLAGRRPGRGTTPDRR
ncbi:hypothetical protein LDO32_11910 [Luteimonas sp. Y-2-2-4F]|nr:hypothetical protein [Luteimonas sp. Y-2-2-4F]MCD9032431.1 hypothetical protein [Luteimonas sp. Y-2-2-4F]